MKRTFKSLQRKTISILLTLSMIITGFPIVSLTNNALAAGETTFVDSTNSSTQAETVSLQSLVDSNGYLTDNGLKSLKALPYDPKKYIDDSDNGNGTRSLKVYSDPIKYKDNNGEYVNIDNSIVAENTMNQAQYQYKNAASDIQILMSNDLNQGNAIQMNYQGYSIGFKPLSILNEGGKSSANINFEQAGTNHKDTSYDNTKKYKAVHYSGTFDSNTDIRVIPNASGLKEDIILNQISSVTEFSYELSVKNVVPLLRRDGNIYFVDLSKGMIIVVIPKPYMYDSSPESGLHDIAVTLQKTGDDTYKYTLLPDQNFLKNAVYPVVIDPTINTQAGGIYDTFIKSTSANSNYNSVVIAVGRDGSGNIYRGLIQITPDELTHIKQTITQGYTISNVKYYAYESYVGNSSPTVELHPITADWVYTTVNWSNQPGIDPTLTSNEVQAVNWYWWDITNLGLDWYDDTNYHHYGKPTYGILLKNDNETLNMYKEFYSDQYTNNKDYFQFTYSDITAPAAPTSVTTTPVATSTWTNDTTATLTWSGITDAGSGVARAEYQIDSTTGTWTQIPTGNGIASGSIGISVTAAGTHTIYVRGVDNAGNNGATRSVVYKLDPPANAPTAPTSVTTTPVATSTWTNDTTPTLTWSGITDTGGSGLLRAEYQIDSGTWAPIPTGNGIASGSIGISITAAGTHTIYVRGVDNAGNNGATRSVVYKLDPPANAPTAPTSVTTNPVATSTWTYDTTPTLTWSGITDTGGSGLLRAEYQIDSGTWAPIPIGNGVASGSIGISITAAGTHTIYVRGVDNAGNNGATRSVVYKLDPPANAPTAPTSVTTTPVATSTWTNDTTPTLTWSGITDTGGSLLLRAEYQIDSGTWAPIPTGNGIASGSIGITISTSGTHTIYVRGVDNATNVGPSGSVTYKLDVISPTEPTTLTTSPNAISNWTNDSTPTITWSGMTDAHSGMGSGLSKAQYQIDGGTWIDIPTASGIASGTYTVTTALATGTHTIKVRGWDNAGNYSNTITKSVTYKVDVTLPAELTTLTTSPVATSSWTSVTTPTILWSGITDAHSGMIDGSSKAQYQIDGGSWVDIPTTSGITSGTYLVPTALTTGTHAIKVRGWDNVGNYSNTLLNSVTYKVDVTPPRIADQVYVIPSGTIDNDNPILYWNWNTSTPIDNESGVQDIEYKVMQGSTLITDWTSTGTASGQSNIQLNMPIETDGTYVFYIRAIDNCDNIGVEKTTTPPQVSIVSPTNNVYVYNNIQIEGTASDFALSSWTLEYGAGETPSTYTTISTGTTNITNSILGNWNTDGLADGVYTLRLRASDGAANISQTSIEVTKDSLNPVVEITSPGNGAAVAGTVTITGTASDDNMSSWLLEYGVGSSPTEFIYVSTGAISITNNTLGSLDTTELSNGIYTLKLSAIDQTSPTGNSAQITLQITVNNLPPIDLRLGVLGYWTMIPVSIATGSGQVNSITGNLNYQITDFNNSDSPMPLSLDRTYNSLSPIVSAMGKGWDWNYNVYLIREYATGQETAVILKDGSGAYHRFACNVDGTYARPVGEYLYLTLDNGIYTITDKSGSQMIFDGNLRLATISDRNNNAVTLTYYPSGNLDTVNNNFGQSLKFDYPTDGLGMGKDLVDTVTDAYNRVFHFVYNEDNLLEQVYITDLAGNDLQNREIYAYNELDLLEEVTDPEGNLYTVGYYANQKVEYVSNPLSEAQTISYNADQVTTSTFRGATTTYDCDANGLLVTLTDAQGYETNYTYDDNYNMESLSKQVVLGYENGALVTSITVTESWDYDLVTGNLESYTDANNNISLYEDYNAFGAAGTIKKPLNTVNDILTYATTSYTYDTYGNITSETDPLGHTTDYVYYPTGAHGMLYTATTNNKTSTYIYDTTGRSTIVTDPLGKTTKVLAYEMGQPILLENENGNITKKEYDILGRLKKAYSPMEDDNDPDNSIWDNHPYESTVYDKNGNVKETTTVDGVTTVYDYDALNRQTGTTVGDDVTSVGYSVNGGNLVATTTTAEGISIKKYNALDQLVQTTEQGVVTDYTYNATGNQMKIQDDQGKKAYFKYDVLNRQTDAYEDPDAKNIHIITQYDLYGRVIDQNDGMGSVTVTTYEGADERPDTVTVTKNGVVHQTSYSYDVPVTEGGKTYIVNTVTNEDGSKATYTDDAGNVSKEVNALTGGTIFTFLYNTSGSVTTINVGTTTIRQLVQNDYDNTTGTDQLKTSTYANGDSREYAYDDETGRLISEKYDGETSARYEYQYDEQGNLSFVWNHESDVGTRYTYENGQMTQIDEGSVTVDQDGRFILNVTARTYVIAYDNGQVDSITETKSGQTNTISYEYDAQNNNRMKVANFTYGSNTAKVAWGYDDYGRLDSRIVYDNNTTQRWETTMSYTENTYATAYVYQMTNKRLGQSGYDKTLTYGYDANHNITSISDGTNTTTYAYDDKEQLTRENNQAEGMTWVWVYNAGGNITYKKEYAYAPETVKTEDLGTPSSIETYTYDPNGWTDILTSYDGNVITYDDSGNPLSDGTWTYTWEAERNLIGLSKTGTTITYAYNNDGLRTSKTVTVNGVSTITNYTLSGTRVTSETNGTDTIQYRYDASGKLISMNLNGAEYYYFRNAQSDIVGFFDNTGTVVVEYTYDAWGKMLTCTGPLANTVGVINPYLYKGYRFDVETGWYYLQSRYYCSLYCRFINSDSIYTNLNLYNYCYGNPVNYSDPTGYIPTLNDMPRPNIAEFLAILTRGDSKGRYLLERWIYGGGKEIWINNDDSWNRYLAGPSVPDFKKTGMNRIRYNIMKFQAYKAWKAGKNSFNVSGWKMELPYNGYSTGLQLLHGTNSTVGGFSVDGKIVKERGRFRVYGTFTWNDILDPNATYDLDDLYYYRMKKYVLTPGNGRDFTIHITCSYSYLYGPDEWF